jgi:threonine synthase
LKQLVTVLKLGVMRPLFLVAHLVFCMEIVLMFYKIQMVKRLSLIQYQQVSIIRVLVQSTHTFTDIGRAEYRGITDAQAMHAFALLSKTEGIIPAIETAHALAGAIQVGNELGPEGIILINLSGRGDKDVQTAAQYFGIPL